MKPETLGRNAASITQVAVMLTLVLAFIFISISIPITSAEITELNVEPEVVAPGEVITISGKAAPGEEVWLRSSFELPLPVAADGRYSREFKDIHFPKGEKKFSMRAENVKNIQMSLSLITATCDGETIKVGTKILGRTIPLIEKPLKITNDVVTLSFSFPMTVSGMEIDMDGKKDIKIDGDAAAGATSVSLNLATSIKVVADTNGDFSLDLNTEGVPEGTFLITGGKKDKTVYIGCAPTPISSPAQPPASESAPSIPPAPPSPMPTSTPSASPSHFPSTIKLLPFIAVVTVIIAAVLTVITVIYRGRK